MITVIIKHICHWIVYVNQENPVYQCMRLLIQQVQDDHRKTISILRPIISQNNLNNKGFLYKYNDYKKNCER